MKIVEVIAHPLALDHAQPSWTAHERFDRAQLVLVELRTDEGIVGIGEIQGGPQALICELVAMFGAVATGMNPLEHEAIWQRLMSVTTPRPGGLGGWDGLPPPLPRHHRAQAMAAIGGIDIALWDIKGKAAGQPVWRLLGGVRSAVFTYVVGGFYVEGAPLRACADEFAQYAAQGYRAVKLKTGALSLADELERINSVRAAIGPGVQLMLDMNAPYDVEGCIAFAQAVAPCDIFWLEEPLHWYLQPADYVRLATATDIKLAHGEREWHRWTVRDFIDSGAIGYVQFDATRHAGFTEALRIADHARQKGVLVSPHSAAHIHGHLVSALGDAAHAAESVGNPDRHPIHHRIYEGAAEYANGMLQLPDRPGFGFSVDWRQVAKCRA